MVKTKPGCLETRRMVEYLMAKEPKQKITKVSPEATSAWRGSTPYGGSTNQWREWGKSNPNRISNAARTMRERKETRTEDPNETTEQWLARRPQGGGRGLAAPHKEWVDWGKSKPGRASRAGKIVAAHREANKPKNPPKPKVVKPKKAKKAKKK